MTTELIKGIKGYRGKYSITHEGKVYSHHHKRYLKSFVNTNYLRVNLSIGGVVKKCRVHRLVAEAFIPNTENKSQINHIDGDKLNNNVSNLEWVTASENTKHAYDLGLHKQTGTFNGNSKLTEKEVIEIRKVWSKTRGLKLGITQKDLADKYKVSNKTISAIILRKTWSHI